MMARQPPLDVLEAAGIDAAALEPVPWEDPIWRFDLDGLSCVLSYKTGRTDESLDWEAKLLDACEDRGFPSVRSVKVFGDKDHFASGNAHYVARSWIDGQTMVEVGYSDLAELGRFIASFHDTCGSIAMPQRPSVEALADVLSYPSDGVLAEVLGGDDRVASYRAISADVVDRLSDRPDPVMPIHGDFTTRNVVVDGSPPRIAGLLDFGVAMMANPDVELAYALGSTRYTYANVEHRVDRIIELIRGYTSVRALGSDSPQRIVDHARSRPLLSIAMRARADRPPRSKGSLDRAIWLTENRDEVVGAIEQGMSRS